ncbi:putative oxidoreductase [Phytophthora citrophthora]|uniref:Oxidoreductase n=1 Tax=Phytophthora citrophthora TaxID=4793 RepID=A0AAD9G0N2_9STRA|nr:putative oxidoreductase [Phytophthora citrophthora]
MTPVPPNAKVWLVTGCASGLGREVVLAALAHGDCVIATARNPERLADLEKKGARTLALDVTASQEELNAVAAQALSMCGTIDVLVNNAAYLLEGAIEECR